MKRIPDGIHVFCPDSGKKNGGVDRSRTDLRDFADRCLTVWLPRLIESLIHKITPHRYFVKQFCNFSSSFFIFSSVDDIFCRSTIADSVDYHSAKHQYCHAQTQYPFAFTDLRFKIFIPEVKQDSSDNY